MYVKVAKFLAVLVLVVAAIVVNGERNLTLPWGKNPKRTYMLELNGIEKFEEQYTTEYVKIDYFRLSRINDTQGFYVIKAKMQVKKELPKTAMITVHGHQQLANYDYDKASKGNLQYSLCDFLENSVFIYYDLLKHSNLPEKCPVKKGEYVIDNYTVNEYYLYPEMPPGGWKVVWKIMDKPRKGKVIFQIAILLTVVDHPNSVPPEPSK